MGTQGCTSHPWWQEASGTWHGTHCPPLSSAVPCCPRGALSLRLRVTGQSRCPPMGDPEHPEGCNQDTSRTALWHSDRPCSRTPQTHRAPRRPQPCTAPGPGPGPAPGSGSRCRSPTGSPGPVPVAVPVAHQVLVEADEPRLPVVVEHEDGVDHPGGGAGPGREQNWQQHRGRRLTAGSPSVAPEAHRAAVG